jgi:hypothetical protein
VQIHAGVELRVACGLEVTHDGLQGKRFQEEAAGCSPPLCHPRAFMSIQALQM